jgi:hypothetical protein
MQTLWDGAVLRVLTLIAGWLFLWPPAVQGQSPWYARDRWQLELSTGGVIFECHLRERKGDDLLIVEADSTRRVSLAGLTGMRLLRPAAKTVAHGARGTFGALAGADDEVYQLTLLMVPERRQVVDSLLRRYHPPS